MVSDAFLQMKEIATEKIDIERKTIIRREEK